MPGVANCSSKLQCLGGLLLYLLCSCNTACSLAYSQTTGHRVYYTGAISTQHNERFFSSIQKQPVERLIITSSGGEVAAAIELGLWLHERQLDIEVPEYCLSSCANYVFPAARNKLIRDNAIVAWHGNYHHLKSTGLWRDEITQRMQQHNEDANTATHYLQAQVERLVNLEHEFFTRIGVDQYLCWIGKMPPHNAPDYYFLSTRDMARFGVNSVRAPPGYEHTDLSDFDSHIVFIELHGDD